MSRKLLICMISAIAAVFIITACQFKEPVLPAWEATFRLPFDSGVFIIGEEIVNDSTIVILSGDADSVIFISLKDSLVNLREISASDLSIKLDSASEALKLGTLVITNLQTLDFPLMNLRTIFPELEGSIGSTVTIPATTVSPPGIVLNAGDFKRIHFLNGVLRLRILNKLPFPIGPNSISPNGLQITVVNDSLNETFLTFGFPDPILPGEEAVSEATIQNKWLYSPLRLEYEIPVAQPTTVTVTNALLDTTGVAVSLELNNIQADEAVAVLGPQDFSDIIKVGYEGQHRLRSAEIDKGMLQVNFTNHTPLDTDMKVKIPAIRSAANDTFIAEITLPAGETVPLPLDLDNYRISNPDMPGAFLDTLEIIFDAKTQAQSNIIHISSSDSISISVNSDTLTLQSFSGFLGPDSLNFDPIVEDDIADYQGFEGGIELSEALLSLKFYSEVLIENLNADLVITGLHKNEEGAITDSAAIILNNQEFNGGQPGNPGITEITLNNQGIVDFLSILPTSIRIEGRIRVSGEAAIAQGNRIWMDYALETPFTIKITGTANFEGNVSTISDADIDTLFQDAARDNILDVDIRFILTNHTPLGGTMRFIISKDFSDPNIYDQDYDTSLVIIRDIDMDPAPIDPQTGFVTEARETDKTLYLNRREVQLFGNLPLRYGYLLQVPGTGDFVTLRYSDFVKMLGRANLRVLLNNK